MTRDELFVFVKSEYGTEPEYLWLNLPDCAVLRNKNGKWYAVIMPVPKNKFGIESDDIVDVLNVKAEMLMVDTLISQPGFYRAYHMNKNQWISIFLDGSVPDEMIKSLVFESYVKTGTKNKKKNK